MVLASGQGGPIIAAKAPFKFWSFFFSTRGRVSRVPFALFEIPILLVFQGIASILVPYLMERYGVRDGKWMAVNLVTGIVSIALLWPRFAVAVKRLHDMNWPWWPALPLWLPFLTTLAAGVANYLDAANNLQTAYGRWIGFYWISYGLGLYTIGLVVVLALLPGHRDTNRYGPAPRNPTTSPDVF